LRYLGASQAQIETAAPRLAAWLGHVFRVLGGYIAATGILTMALAATAYRQHRRSAAIAAASAGAVSIGLMSAVNFAIGSDFKWVLSAIAALWACSIVRYGFEASRSPGGRSGTSSTELPAALLGYETISPGCHRIWGNRRR
jgi:kynureninase